MKTRNRPGLVFDVVSNEKQLQFWGYDAVQSGRSVPTFRKKLLPPSLG